MGKKFKWLYQKWIVHARTTTEAKDKHSVMITLEESYETADNSDKHGWEPKRRGSQKTSFILSLGTANLLYNPQMREVSFGEAELLPTAPLKSRNPFIAKINIILMPIMAFCLPLEYFLNCAMYFQLFVNNTERKSCCSSNFSPLLLK